MRQILVVDDEKNDDIHRRGSFTLDGVIGNERGGLLPGENACATCQERVEHYLDPLANLLDLRYRLHLQGPVEVVSRSGFDVLKDKGRFEAPCILRIEDPDGERNLLADVVIDASGTFDRPNWMGAPGLAALGEARRALRVTYGLPTVLKKGRARTNPPS